MYVPYCASLAPTPLDGDSSTHKAIIDFLLSYSKSPWKRRQPHDLENWRFHNASTTLPLRFCYDHTTTMKIRLGLVHADGDAASTLLRPRRWSYAFVALLYPFYIKCEVQLNVNDRHAHVALLQLAIMNQKLKPRLYAQFAPWCKFTPGCKIAPWSKFATPYLAFICQ